MNAKQLELVRAAQDRPWLVNPGAFQPHVLRAVLAPCPAAREVAKERERRLDYFRHLPLFASTGYCQGDPEAADRKLAGPTGKQLRAVRGSVGVIPVRGPVGERLGPELMKAGGTSYEEISAALDAMLADKACDAIVLDVSSPGGESYGLGELSDKIYNARGQKPIYAISNSMCCSAAFWMATSCGHEDTPRMFCTPGGDVGSVGCYLLHVDESGKDEQEGLKVSFISSGRYKTEGNPHEPLGMEARAYLQGRCDEVAAKFEEALSRNRGLPLSQIRERFGQGRVVGAEAALAAGMVDRIMTFEQLMSKLTGQPMLSPGRGTRTSAQQVRRLRTEQARRKSAVLLSGIRLDAKDGDGSGDGPKPAGMSHTDATSPREPLWEDVDQEKLPDQAFADPGEREYAHHWVENGGDQDEQGRYCSGTMYLHAAGCQLAHAQAEADDAEPETCDHLSAHCEALGMSEEDED